MTPAALVVDTDGGTDDAVALWWALTTPRVELVAILVTAGVVPRDAGATNVLRILHAAGRPEVPVALGAAASAGTGGRHGADGLGGFGDRWSTGGLAPTVEPASDLLRRLSAERPGELDLAVIGPLSTLAAAVTDGPDLPERLRSLTVMGGTDDTNARLDPTAAAAVPAMAWPRPPQVVGLDVTLRTLLHDVDLALAAKGRTPAARFLADPLRAYAEACQRAGLVPEGRCPVHDLVAVLAAVDPSTVGDEAHFRQELVALVS